MNERDKLKVLSAQMETPSHRKRSKTSSLSKSFKKSKHKHMYQPCLLSENSRLCRASYCTICGKINDLRFSETERLPSGCYRLLSQEEVWNLYKDYPVFEVSDVFVSHVSLGVSTD